MRFNPVIKTGSLYISEATETFIIAEGGVNHCGDMELAREMVDCAAESGADAIKFQSFKAEHLILPGVAKAEYQKASAGNESQFEMLRALEITLEQTMELKNYCIKKGILFLTTPFDEESLRELDEVDLPAYKVASTDITNLPFILRVAKKDKPVFLSTGMASLSEIQSVLKEIYPLNRDVVLMHCTANYPVSDNEVNLRVFNTYRKTFDILLGFSDHSIGIGAAPYAVPLGAKVVEKHFTLDKKMKGPDHQASLDPSELGLFVKEIKRVDSFLGRAEKVLTPSEIENRRALQKCMVAATEIKKGELFTLENVVAKRTGGKGLSPLHFRNLVGKRAQREYRKNEIVEPG